MRSKDLLSNPYSYYGRPELRPRDPYRYLYLRHSTKLVYAEQELLDLFDALDQRCEVLSLIKDEPSWPNGMVWRFQSKATIDELREQLAGALAPFETWALLDMQGEVADSINGGPAAAFFHPAYEPDPDGDPEQEQWRVENEQPVRTEVAQLYVVHRRDDRDPQATADQLIQATKAFGRSVFHFDNGRVILLDTDQPARLIKRRLETFANQVWRLIVVDKENNWERVDPGHGPVWDIVAPDECITYGANNNDMPPTAGVA